MLVKVFDEITNIMSDLGKIQGKFRIMRKRTDFEPKLDPGIIESWIRSSFYVFG